MVQLNQFTFDRGGSLVFDDRGEVVDIGERMYNDGINFWDGKRPGTRSWTGMGPLTDRKAYYLFTLDRLVGGYPVRCQPDEKRQIKSLRMFIDWACDNTKIAGKQWVLSHPDLDLQNILVAEDGTVRAFIDWDGAGVVPREIGCALYPIWLMQDWMCNTRGYAVDFEEMESLRAMYAQFMEAEIERRVGGPGKLTELGTTPRQEADITRRSLLMKMLDYAANWPCHTEEVVDNIYQFVEELMEEEKNAEHSNGDAADGTDDYSERWPTVAVDRDHGRPIVRFFDSLIENEQQKRRLDADLVGIRTAFLRLQTLSGDSEEAAIQQVPSNEVQKPEKTSTKVIFDAITPGLSVVSRMNQIFQLGCGRGKKSLRWAATLFQHTKEQTDIMAVATSMRSKLFDISKNFLRWLQPKLRYFLNLFWWRKGDSANSAVSHDFGSQDSGRLVKRAPEKQRITPVKDKDSVLAKVKDQLSTRKETSHQEKNGIEDAGAFEAIAHGSEVENDEEQIKNLNNMWKDAECEIKRQGFPISSVRDHQVLITASIVEALKAKSAKPNESSVSEAFPKLLRGHFTIDDIEAQSSGSSKVMKEDSDALPANHSFNHDFDTSKPNTKIPESSVPSPAEKQALGNQIANNYLKNLLGLHKADTETAVPENTKVKETSVKTRNQKLKALLGVGSSVSRKLQPWNAVTTSSPGLESVESTDSTDFEESKDQEIQGDTGGITAQDPNGGLMNKPPSLPNEAPSSHKNLNTATKKTEPLITPPHPSLSIKPKHQQDTTASTMSTPPIPPTKPPSQILPTTHLNKNRTNPPKTPPAYTSDGRLIPFMWFGAKAKI